MNVQSSSADFHKGDMESAQIITLTLELLLYIKSLGNLCLTPYTTLQKLIRFFLKETQILFPILN